MERARKRLDHLDTEERSRHILAQGAVRAFRRERDLTQGFALKDALEIVLSDAHGGTVGRRIAQEQTFLAIVAIYHR